MKLIVNILKKIVNSTSPDKDEAGREFIINVLLVGSIILGFTALIANIFYYYKDYPFYKGLPLQITLSIIIIFCYLLALSHLGKAKLSAYTLVFLLLISAIYTSYSWGVDVPQALLIYALVIVMAGILISTKFAFIITILTSILLFVIFHLQHERIILANTAWTNEPLHLGDVGVYAATLGVIAVVSWLFNREIEKALQRARRSEKALRKERDFLEVRVEERTKELKKAQLEKVSHLYRLADFGRMAAGLFHDLAGPLTTVSLNLEQLQSQTVNPRPILRRAIEGTKRMENFVKAVRKQIQKQQEKVVFSLNQEITQAFDVQNHKAKDMGVKLHFVYNKTIRTYGNPLRFNQLITNLVSNAIEAYERIQRRKNRQVIIKLSSENGKVTLVVQDFGSGIPKRNLKKIYDPFFTTKSIDKGTGMGLSICRDIVEKGIGGRIKVESKEGEGTAATVEFPIRKYEDK